MTVNAVSTKERGDLTLQFGTEPLVVPCRVGELVTRHVATRRGHATVATSNETLWLFPGGQAGRHLGPDRLSLRLQGIGITTRAARTNTLLDPAADTPLVVLAALLGTMASIRPARRAAKMTILDAIATD